MCRVASYEFDALAGSVPATRHFVADRLDRWEAASMKETALLLTSELVSNSIQHAASGGVVTAAMVGDVLEVGVTDFDPQSLSAVKINPKSQKGSARQGAFPRGGRGLMLVGRLADEWGVKELAQGKHVWFRLRKDDWIFAPSCRCNSEDVDRVRIGSGQFVSVIVGPWDH